MDRPRGRSPPDPDLPCLPRQHGLDPALLAEIIPHRALRRISPEFRTFSHTPTHLDLQPTTHPSHMSDAETPAKEAPAKESKPSKESSCESAHATDKLAIIFSSILLRLWLGVRALQTGIEKYAGNKASNEEVEAGGEATGLYAGTTEKAYSLDFYKGVPDAWAGKLQDQPLMIGFFYNLFDKLLGPALIVMGLTILLGVGSRISLMAQGLLYVGLTWGLILIGGPQGAAGAAQLGVHIVLIVMALHFIKHDRLVILKKW